MPDDPDLAADDAADDAPGDEAPAVEQRRVQLRRSPKYGIFMVLGAGLGAAAGFIWTQLTPPNLDTQQPVDVTQLTAFMALVGAVVGLALGGLVAVILDRTVGRRTRTVVVERTRGAD